MEALVIGGSGHIGNNLVRLLLQKGWKVRVLISSSKLPLQDKNLSYINGNIADYSSMLQVIKKDDVVFDLAAKISLYKKDNSLYSINYMGTKNVVDACIKNKAKKLIYVSSSHVIDPKAKGILTEPNTTLDTNKYTDDYGRTKAMG